MTDSAKQNDCSIELGLQLLFKYALSIKTNTQWIKKVVKTRLLYRMPQTIIFVTGLHRCRMLLYYPKFGYFVCSEWRMTEY